MPNPSFLVKFLIQPTDITIDINPEIGRKMKKTMSLALCFILSLSVFAETCGEKHFKKYDLNPEQRWIKSKMGKFSDKFDDGFLHTRSFFRLPAKLQTKYYLTLRRLIQKFINKNRKPAYFIHNDEASYAVIMKYIQKFGGDNDDFTKAAMESVLSNNGINKLDIDITPGDIGRFKENFSDGAGEELIGSVEEWISKYKNYNKNMDDLYEEAAYRQHAIQKLSELRKRVTKDGDPFEVHYIVKDNVSGIIEKTKMISDVDQIDQIIKEQLTSLREIKGTWGYRGSLLKIRDDQAVLNVRLNYLKDELVHLEQSIDDKLMPKELLEKIEEIRLLLKDPNLKPDEIATFKLSKQEYKAEWQDFKSKKEEIEARINQRTNDIINKLSPEEKKMLGIDKARRWVRVKKVSEVFLSRPMTLLGSGSIGLLMLWRYLNYDKDLRYECITGAATMKDDGTVVVNPFPGQIPGQQIPGGPIPGQNIPPIGVPGQLPPGSIPILPVEEPLGIGPGLAIPGTPISGVPPMGSPMQNYYYSNQEFLMCVIQRYIPSKYPDKYLKMLDDNEYRPFDPAKVNTASSSDKEFMQDWNNIFVMRKEYLEQLIADQEFDKDMYEEGMIKIQDSGLDSLETKLAVNPYFGGNNQIPPNQNPIDPTTGLPGNGGQPSPIPVSGNPNIPTEQYVGYGVYYYDQRNVYEDALNQDQSFINKQEKKK